MSNENLLTLVCFLYPSFYVLYKFVIVSAHIFMDLFLANYLRETFSIMDYNTIGYLNNFLWISPQDWIDFLKNEPFCY